LHQSYRFEVDVELSPDLRIFRIAKHAAIVHFQPVASCRHVIITWSQRNAAERAMSTVKLTYDSDHHVTATKEPQHKIVAVDIPHQFSAVDMRRIENAAELCPIKTNIGDDTEITVKFNYADAEAA